MGRGQDEPPVVPGAHDHVGQGDLLDGALLVIDDDDVVHADGVGGGQLEAGEDVREHRLGGKTRDDFVRFRTERDATLDMPALILPSVQINMRAGQLPAPESNGTRYLKIPLDAL